MHGRLPLTVDEKAMVATVGRRLQRDVSRAVPVGHVFIDVSWTWRLAPLSCKYILLLLRTDVWFSDLIM